MTYRQFNKYQSIEMEESKENGLEEEHYKIYFKKRRQFFKIIIIICNFIRSLQKLTNNHEFGLWL